MRPSPSSWTTLRSPSLRAQVALVVAVLSFLPNLLMVLVVYLPTYARLGGTGAAWRSLALWLIATALLSAAIGYILSRQLLLPLSRLTAQIDRLRDAPDKVTRARLELTPNEPREVRTLKGSFNDLLGQVATEQGRRGSFMATLMHDLKTPLIAANTLLAVIRDDDALSRQERLSIADKILQENVRLTELVQKMVDAHRFERRDVPLNRERVNLETLVANVLERVRSLIEERAIAVVVQGKAHAEVDPRELERALYNLISNAVRYAESRISIEIFPGLIRLADDGPGLPLPLSTLAQPFNTQPVELAGRRYAAGTGGLGLFIARRILEAHRGQLSVESSGPKGTVFLIYVGGGA